MKRKYKIINPNTTKMKLEYKVMRAKLCMQYQLMIVPFKFITKKKKKHFGNVIGPLEFPPRKNERKEKGPTQPKIIPQFESHDNYQF